MPASGLEKEQATAPSSGSEAQEQVNPKPVESPKMISFNKLFKY